MVSPAPRANFGNRWRAPADGYTLLDVTHNTAISATLYEKLDYDFIRDITPIGSVFRVPLVMSVNSSFPTKTVPEFIAYAKANPSKISMASAGIGHVTHLSGELIKAMAGVQHDSRALSWPGSRDCRSGRRTGAGAVRRHTRVH
jgi:tripartite-type tricarboxylate transporter receptor subunit TctC